MLFHIRTLAPALVFYLSFAPAARGDIKTVPITVDASAAPDLREWGDRARQLCEIWYPVIKDLLPNDPSALPASVKIVLDPVIDGGIPAYASGNELHVNGRYLREQLSRGNSDFGMIIHELTHTVQRYTSRAGWLVEGIADYIRYERFEPTGRRRDYDPEKERHDRGYWVTSGFLAWIEQSYDGGFVEKLHRALTTGSYREDQFFEKITGKNLAALWQQFVQIRKQQRAATPPLLAMPARKPATGVEARGPGFEATLVQARKEQKPVIVYFGAVWCGPCKNVEAYTTSAAGKAALAKVRLVHYDVDTPAGKLVETRYPGRGLPRFVAVDFSGRELARTEGWSGEGGHPEFFAVVSAGLEKSLAVDDLLALARKDPEDTPLQLAAGRRLLEARRLDEARPLLARASSASSEALAARAAWALAELELEAQHLAQARKQAELLVEKHPGAPDSLVAFRWLATLPEPPVAKLTAMVSTRLQSRSTEVEVLSDLLLYSLKAGALEAAGKLATRLEKEAASDPRRAWLLAEAAHARRNQKAALALGRKALVLADSRLAPRLGRDLERYRRRDPRPSGLMAALMAPSAADRWPPACQNAFARLPRSVSTRPDLKMGIIGQWRFDEAAGMAAADSSGKGNTGVLLGFGEGDRAAGRAGRALSFESARRTTVMVRNSEFLNPRQEITVAAWVKASDWSGNRRVVQKGVSDNQYRLTAEGGELKFEVATESGRYTAAGPLPAKDVWTHVAGTYDGKKVRLLINGVEVAAAPASGGPLAVTPNALAIGCKTTENDPEFNCFRGAIDDVVLYDRALNDQELTQLAGNSRRS
jgi:thioredoxin-like negative regulator of GroEL